MNRRRPLERITREGFFGSAEVELRTRGLCPECGEDQGDPARCECYRPIRELPRLRLVEPSPNQHRYWKATGS